MRELEKAADRAKTLSEKIEDLKQENRFYRNNLQEESAGYKAEIDRIMALYKKAQSEIDGVKEQCGREF